MAKEILNRIFRSRRALGHTLWLGGAVLSVLLAWMLAGWLALHSAMELAALRWIWGGAVLLVAAGSLHAWRRTALSFGAWVAREEQSCRVPRLWSTVVGVAPGNPFFVRLNAEAAEALRTHRGYFQRALARRWLGLLAIAAALLGAAPLGRALLGQLKIQMALGWVDDAIVTQAPASIARGEAWTLRVQTLQPGPWVAEIQGVPIALTNGSVTLQSLRTDTKYRILAAWGKSRWHTVSVYEPVRWTQLQLTVRLPSYLQLPAETFDLLAPASQRGGSVSSPARLVVAGSQLSLRGKPAVEWSDPLHRDDWVAKTDETDQVRPVEAGRHGLWLNLPFRVVPDAPPEVRWIRPEQDIAWGEKKTSAEIEASDDWNVCAVGLRIRRLGASHAADLSLYRGRERQRRISTELTPAVMPDGAQTGLYELTPFATDSAGQTTQGEKRFLEIKPELKPKKDNGTFPEEPASLRGVIVALLDTLRDWNREGRPERLGRVRLELDAMAKVADTAAFRDAAERWIEALNDRAGTQDVEGVVQEMVKIQQQSESQPPKEGPPPQSPGKPRESVSASDLDQIAMLQRAALDGNISPQLRDALQKKVQEQFQAKSETLKEQVPGASALVREIGMTQEKLTRQWSTDLAKADLQQLEMLKGQLQSAPPRAAGQTDPSKQGLLDAVQGQAEAGHAITDAQLSSMRELSSRDGATDWSSLEAASEKWNRARQSGLAALRERAQTALLRELQKSAGSPTPSSAADPGLLARAIGAAAAHGDWENAERFAQEAQWTPEMLGQLQRAERAPSQLQKTMVTDLLGQMLNNASQQAQTQGRRELEKVMPIDPAWEPTVDQYFDKLNHREAPP